MDALLAALPGCRPAASTDGGAGARCGMRRAAPRHAVLFAKTNPSADNVAPRLRPCCRARLQSGSGGCKQARACVASILSAPIFQLQPNRWFCQAPCRFCSRPHRPTLVLLFTCPYAYASPQALPHPCGTAGEEPLHYVGLKPPAWALCRWPGWCGGVAAVEAAPATALTPSTSPRQPTQSEGPPTSPPLFRAPLGPPRSTRPSVQQRRCAAAGLVPLMSGPAWAASPWARARRAYSQPPFSSHRELRNCPAVVWCPSCSC
jgi:hypothetical protein